MPDQELTEQELVERIQTLNNRYWNEAESEVEDAEYDLLTRQLESLHPGHPLLQEVHAPVVVSSGDVRLAKPMLSLDKAYSLSEVMIWARKHARSETEIMVVQPKYDGISAVFENGILASRGDGVMGKNISDKIPLIELETADGAGPLNRPVRGEILIRADEFKNKWHAISRQDRSMQPTPYKNPRNAIAGILGLDQITHIAFQMERLNTRLTFVDYNKISYDIPLNELETAWPDLVSKIEVLPYPTDGIVVKFKDTAYGESLGSTDHHPKGQIAFKFSNIRRQTRLLDVEWGFGKNSLTPVAKLEPVEIGGITIRNATLHNLQNILDRDLQIGDEVTVERAGDVIPYIVESRPGNERRSPLITHCPACQTELARRGPELICPNPECPGTQFQRLCAAVKSVGIENLGEPTLKKMMERLGVRTLKDIFSLSVNDLLRLDGFQDKSAISLYRNIQNVRTLPLDQLIAALNIPGIGRVIARKMLEVHPFETLRQLPENELATIFGIGPERAKLLYQEFQNQSEFIDELLRCVNPVTIRSGVAKTICFTGKMAEKRSYYENLAKVNGWEAVNDVTGSLSLLVIASPDESSSKRVKAEHLRIPVIPLEHWMNTLETREIRPESGVIQDELALF